VCTEFCRPLLHDWLDVLESQILFPQVLYVHLALFSKNFPVDTDTQVSRVRWVGSTVQLSLIPSFFADVILIPLFHFVPNIKLEHRFVVAEPAVFDSGDVEARYGKEARNYCAKANEDSKLLRLLNWVEAKVIQ
jgi:hypothetical protein